MCQNLYPDSKNLGNPILKDRHQSTNGDVAIIPIQRTTIAGWMGHMISKLLSNWLAVTTSKWSSILVNELHNIPSSIRLFNGGTRKWMVYKGKSQTKNGWFGDIPIWGNLHIQKSPKKSLPPKLLWWPILLWLDDLGLRLLYGNLHSSSTQRPADRRHGTFAAPVVQKLELGKDHSGSRHKGFGGKSWRENRDLAVSNTGKSYEKLRVI